MKLLRYAAIVVVGVNVWMLAQVGINRHWGEVERLDLTERELALASTRAHDATRTLSLRWQGNSPSSRYGFYPSHTMALSETAFNRLGLRGENCQGRRDSRDGFVLLVYGGAPYQRLLAQYQHNLADAETLALSGREDDIEALERAQRQFTSQRQGASRLIAVAVAATESALVETAAEYSEPVLVLPARITPYAECETHKVNVRLSGVGQFHLSRAQAQKLGVSASAVSYNQPLAKPRYRGTLALGALGMPWIESVERCDGECE